MPPGRRNHVQISHQSGLRAPTAGSLCGCPELTQPPPAHEDRKEAHNLRKGTINAQVNASRPAYVGGRGHHVRGRVNERRSADSIVTTALSILIYLALTVAVFALLGLVQRLAERL